MHLTILSKSISARLIKFPLLINNKVVVPRAIESPIIGWKRIQMGLSDGLVWGQRKMQVGDRCVIHTPGGGGWGIPGNSGPLAAKIQMDNVTNNTVHVPIATRSFAAIKEI